MSVCYLCTVGSKGRNKGEFANLQGVAASDTGSVLIADSNNQCVQVTLTSLQLLYTSLTLSKALKRLLCVLIDIF